MRHADGSVVVAVTLQGQDDTHCAEKQDASNQAWTVRGHKNVILKRFMFMH